MCKSVKSKRLFMAAALASFISVLILAGCSGGDKGDTSTSTPTYYTLTIKIEPSNSSSFVYYSKNGKRLNNGDTINVSAGGTVDVEIILGNQEKFIGWDGDGRSKDTALKITIRMDKNKTLTANFQPVYKLVVEKEPAVGGSVSPETSYEEYEAGEQVTLTATPAQGYRFTGWSGASTETTDTVTITMSKNDTLTAKFELISEKYTLTVKTEPAIGGTVSPETSGEVYDAGREVTLTATPAQGYRFTGWSGASTATTNIVKITMSKDTTLTANFELIPAYTLTVKIEPANSGTVSPVTSGQTYAAGQEVTLTAAPASGYRFAGWSGALTSTKDTLTITMSKNDTLTANFVDPCTTADAVNTPGCDTYCTVDAVNKPTCQEYCTVDAVDKYECASGGFCMKYPNDDPRCANDPCAIEPQPTCAGYCNVYPNAVACQDNPCLTNPTPGCDNYCDVYPTAPGCVNTNPCDADADGVECGVYCFHNENAPECQNNPCATAPTINNCPAFCTIFSDAPGCSEPDLCATNPTPNCQNYCEVYPDAPECQSDPCATNPTPDCDNYCDVDPETKPTCPGYVDPKCTANPYLEGCPRYNECAAGPTAPGCEEFCEVNSSYPGCEIEPPPEKKWCYWEPNSYNDYTGGCCEIGVSTCPATTAACEVTGVVKNTSNCDGLPTTIDPCDDGATVECCAFKPSYIGCEDLPPVVQYYCRWDASGCQKINNPDALKDDCVNSAGDPTPCPNGMTFKEGCQMWGFLSEYSDCRDYVPPTVEYYCYWVGTTGCTKINNPSGTTDNPPLTNLENCETNSQPEKSFPSMAACQAWEPPAVQQFCNYGTCVGSINGGDGCESGGCYVKKASDTCAGGSTVTSCPAGTKPPNANY